MGDVRQAVSFDTANKYRVTKYQDHDAAQYGHGSSTITCNTMREAMNVAKGIQKNLHGEEECYISFSDVSKFPGLVGSLEFTANESPSEEECWLHPDPNYRGDQDNNFYGTIKEYNQLHGM